MLLEVGGRVTEVPSVVDVQSFLFFLNWICAMARYHTESNNILLTRNHPNDADVRQ